MKINILYPDDNFFSKKIPGWKKNIITKFFFLYLIFSSNDFLKSFFLNSSESQVLRLKGIPNIFMVLARF